MKINMEDNMSEFTRTEDGKIKFELQISAEDYVNALNSAYRRLVNRYPMPGFRKGKVPRKVIEKAYGPDVFWDNEFDGLVQKAYSEALAEHDIVPEMQPKIIFTDVSEENGVSFTVEVVTHPTVELGQYKGIEVEKVEYNVTDADVDAEIKRRLEVMARSVNVDRPLENGDTANIDFEGYVDGEKFEGGSAQNFDLKIGSKTFIPGFEDQMIGMTAGEVRDINVTFPENYQAENLAGKPAVFKVTLHSASVEELPELDDDFVKDTSEYENVEEFKVGIRKELEERAAMNAKIAFENAVIEKVISNAKVDIHPDIINEDVDMQMNRFESQLRTMGTSLEDYLQYAGMTIEDVRKDYYPGAEENLKGQYVMGAIFEAEKLEPTEENYRNCVRRFAPTNEKWDDDKITEELEKNRGKYVSNAIIEAVIDFICSNAVVKEHCDCGCEHDCEHDCDCGCEHDCDCGCEHDCDCENCETEK